MKRWSVDTDGDETALWWSSGYSDKTGMPLIQGDLAGALLVSVDEADPPFAALVAAVRDAGRLRGLAATFSSHLNAQQTFTGAQVAAMLNSKAEVL